MISNCYARVQNTYKSKSYFIIVYLANKKACLFVMFVSFGTQRGRAHSMTIAPIGMERQHLLHQENEQSQDKEELFRMAATLALFTRR